MKNKIAENISLWDNLKIISARKPVILYGMGGGADKILDLCAGKNIKITGVFASDDFARGHSFRGFKVKTLAETEEQHKDFCILIAFATREDEVLARINKLNKKYELYAPDLPVCGGEYFDADFLRENIEAIKKTYSLFADDISRETYINAINFKMSGKIKYLENINSPKSNALDLFDLRDNLQYIDAGAYTGDTIFGLEDYLAEKNIKINKITAVEPDRKNFLKLEKNLRDKNLLHKCELYNIGAWSEETTLTFNQKSGRNSNFNAANNHNCRGAHCASVNNSIKTPANTIDNISNVALNKLSRILIKYDVEGAEREALLGSINIIKNHSPDLIVSLYHKTADLFKLPLLINSINSNYNFYLRKHKYIPCWDLNLYAVTRRSPPPPRLSAGLLN